MDPMELAQDSSSEDSTERNIPRGLRDGFRAYATVHEEDYRRIFQSGAVVFDTNALLNLYRYTPAVCSDFLNVMSAISGRIWIPNQVAAEFWRNRDSALADFSKATNQATQALRKGLETQGQALETWANRISLSNVEKEGLLNKIREVTESTVSRISSYRGAWLEEAQDTSKDRVLLALEVLLADRVGSPFTVKEKRQAASEAVKRIEDKVPPGYEDKNKPPEKRVGDYFVWLQILSECRKRSWQDVLFVTGDTKPDWWRHDDRGNARGPRVELCEELHHDSGATLYMLQPEQFLQHAAEAAGINISTLALAEVEKVDKDAKLNRIKISYGRDRQEVLRAVGKYDQYLATQGFRPLLMGPDCPFDLVVEKGLSFYYVKYLPSPYVAHDGLGEMKIAYNEWASQFDSTGGYSVKFVALLSSAPSVSMSSMDVRDESYFVWNSFGHYMGTSGVKSIGLAEAEM
ncbi:hypothetical protein CLV43_112211 [Umezawaea tangerina]|uniref:PIN like domain-containing protein n=2 Tax=Umezawaea tangerina TaxID=84725 RepID=A0A2T0SSA0_9PSEU|nr:hypothetical protein CLV43_112211 [Umezawaea tangerina]